MKLDIIRYIPVQLTFMNIQFIVFRVRGIPLTITSKHDNFSNVL